ncbi:hypothetical protein PR048_012853 [Dryococelus australis]|uniref:Uncharacterized protein n=1 Tax=Dryococelus australis TaxID=614101 RepID=A0ABQ9HRD5_9NEOP|nr:hypothetical protein PR048_012853 [Dryococelus australis]
MVAHLVTHENIATVRKQDGCVCANYSCSIHLYTLQFKEEQMMVANEAIFKTLQEFYVYEFNRFRVYSRHYRTKIRLKRQKS